MTDDRDTLPGTEPVPRLPSILPPPLPSGEEPATEPTPLQNAVRQAVSEALAPVGRFLDDRSQLMLDVVADAAEARVQVKAAVRTVRRTAWLGVLVLLACGWSVWFVLDQERQDRIRAAEAGERRRDNAVDRINAHTDIVCRAR